MEILDTSSSFENTISFSETEVAVVKAALKTKLFVYAEDVAARTAKFKALVDGLAVAFGLPAVGFFVASHTDVGFGHYDADRNEIVINRRFSLANTLHAFGKYLLAKTPTLAYNEALPQTGQYTPLAFANSLFKSAAPVMFEDAKRAGRLVGTSVPSVSSSDNLNGSCDDPDCTSCDSACDSAPAEQAPSAPAAGGSDAPVVTQRPDIDPENLVDRGNGRGED